MDYLPQNRNGLAAEYSAHGNVSAGGTDFDISGRGVNGLLVGGAFKDPSGLNLGGNGDYVDYGNVLSLGQTQKSFSIWVVAPYLTRYETILHKYDNSNGVGYLLALDNNYVDYYPYYGAESMSASVNIRDGKLHHIVATSNADLHKIYIDGVLSKTNTLPVRDPANSTHFYIGKNYGQNYDFTGKIPKVQIYGRTLSAEEIKQMDYQLKGRY